MSNNAIIEACAAVVDREAEYWESERRRSIEATTELRRLRAAGKITADAFWGDTKMIEQGHIHRARDVLQNAAGLIRLLKEA